MFIKVNGQLIYIMGEPLRLFQQLLIVVTENKLNVVEEVNKILQQGDSFVKNPDQYVALSAPLQSHKSSISDLNFPKLDAAVLYKILAKIQIDGDEMNIFEFACQIGNIKVVKTIRDYAQDVIDVNKANNKNQCTVLMIAACYGNLDVCVYLIEECLANPLLQSTNGYSALHFAVLSDKPGNDSLAIVKFLVEKNKSILELRASQFFSPWRATALEFASWIESVAIAKFLSSKMTEMNQPSVVNKPVAVKSEKSNQPEETKQDATQPDFSKWWAAHFGSIVPGKLRDLQVVKFAPLPSLFSDRDVSRQATAGAQFSDDKLGWNESGTPKQGSAPPSYIR